jgi:putative heme transporter
MAEIERQQISLRIPWPTLLKIIAAVALIYLWQHLVWILMLVLIAIIIAVGLAPAVVWLERRGWSRWLAACALVLLIVGTIITFLVLTWSSLTMQAQNLGTQITSLEKEALRHLPRPVVEMVRQSGATADASMLAPYALSIGRALLTAIAAFVLAWIFVVYLLIEAEPTYRWIRGFVPARHRDRFDRTAADAREVAFGFIVGNVTTSTCAAIYFFTWLTVLGVPGALILAVLAFFVDFIPVLGFYLSCLPAMAMAATQSTTLALAMIPIYLSYDFLENYLIGPRVYAGRLCLSRVAILLAFAVGGELGGVVGAVLALPLAAVYPTIERHWLRASFGEDVVAEHEAVTSDAPTPLSRKKSA